MSTVYYMKKKKKMFYRGDDQHCSPPFKKVIQAIPEIINLGGTVV